MYPHRLVVETWAKTKLDYIIPHDQLSPYINLSLSEVASIFRPFDSRVLSISPNSLKRLHSALMTGQVKFAYQIPYNTATRLDALERQMKEISQENKTLSQENKTLSQENKAIWRITRPLVMIPLRTLVDFLLRNGFSGKGRSAFIESNINTLANTLSVDVEPLNTLFSSIREEGIAAAHETDSALVATAIRHSQFPLPLQNCLEAIFQFAFERSIDEEGLEDSQTQADLITISVFSNQPRQLHLHAED